MERDLRVDMATGYVIELVHEDMHGWEYIVRRAGKYLKSRIGYPTLDHALEAAQEWARAHKERHPNG